MFTILNPLEGGSAFTSAKKASKYLRDGRAVLVRKCVIRFIEADHRHQKATMTSKEAHQRIGYDVSSNSGCLTQRQAKGIPFAGYIGHLGLSA